ncbi:MAG: mandelate racemase/muconate lactonizing enzyme family protein [Haloarculaceae archaeon]
MRIESVDAIPLKYSLGDRGYGASRGITDARMTTLVRLETDTGIVGWGEAFALPKTTAALVDELVADMVRNRDPYDVVGSLNERSYTHMYSFAASAFLQCAISGVDIALWDIVGKDVGRPVHELLGGQNRDSVTPYASTMYMTEYDRDPVEPMREAVDAGFSAAKIKIGRNLDDDVERVEIARDVLGDDGYLMVDFNGNYRADQAIRSANRLERYDIHWIEEPVPPENSSGYRQVREHVDVPLAAGETHYGRFEFKNLIDDRLIDYVQPNLCRCGGFSEAMRIADMAATENLAVRPHVWNSGVGIAAALQFAATVPEYPHSSNRPEPLWFEFDRGENALREELLETPFDPSGGTLEVPTDPGLGVAVDDAAIERYRIDD